MNAPTLMLALAIGIPQGPPESSGPLAGVPHAMSVSSGTFAGSTPMSVTEPYFKQPGFVTAPPSPWSPIAGVPDFRAVAILQGLTDAPDIDAMSIGLDWILSDNLGRAEVTGAASGEWGALSYSVSRATVGIDGTIKEESGLPEGAAGDLFSWVIPGSAMPGIWVDVVTRAQNSTEINIFASGKKADIDAHDVLMSAYSLDPAFLSVLPTQPTLFFSVSPATVGKVPAGWWGSSSNASAATILMTTWNSTSEKWSLPTVFLKPGQLGLTTSDDIDALAVDMIRGRLLFSTQVKAGRDQVLIALPTTTGISVFTYTVKTSGKKVSEHLRMLTTDDVDAICALDPGGGQQARFLPAMLGSLQQPTLLPQLPARTTAVVHRRYDRRQQRDIVDTTLVGWSRPRAPTPGQAALGFTLPGVINSPLYVVGTFKRNPNSQPGDPITVSLPVPKKFTFSNVPILLHWLNNDQNGVDLPHPVLLRL